MKHDNLQAGPFSLQQI